MQRVEDRYDPKHFEKIGRRRPTWLQGVSPDGHHLAMQGNGCEPAGVWDAGTGRLIWTPDGVQAINWTADGRFAFCVAAKYNRAADHPPVIQSPLQSEFTYSLERWTWPDKVIVARCSVQWPTGWPVNVVVSPTGEYAAVGWCEQDDTGFVLVDLSADGGAGEQQLGDGYRFGQHSNVSMGPVFSPDGRYVALSGTRMMWWSEDPENDDGETPWPGGRAWIGTVGVVDTRTRLRREVQVWEDLPRGFLPADPDVPEAEYLREPRFVDDRTFDVELPTGRTQRVTLDGQ